MKFNYKGYTIIQSNYNNHVCIYKNDKLIFHASINEKLTKEELKSLVAFIERC